MCGLHLLGLHSLIAYVRETCVSNRVTLTTQPAMAHPGGADPDGSFLLATSMLPLALLGPRFRHKRPPVTDGDTLPPAGSEVIVVLDDSEDPQAAADAMGVDVTHIYTHVFSGFAGVVREQPVDTTDERASHASASRRRSRSPSMER